jgi:phosphoribosylaminoimidazolecarboxamide formyltransferase/IMP cyclohydrolase
MPRIQRALISVTDKTGIVDFSRQLHERGVEIISTGGSAKLLRDSGIAVREVADVTGFPEMLDGRVKTLHPSIAGGILAVRSKPEHMRSLLAHRIPEIQMVVVNLYRFEDVAKKAGVSREELLENIDIGGPTLIRAAAKNFQDVAVVVKPAQYQPVLQEIQANAGALTQATLWGLAQEAFATTAAYDSAIASRLAQVEESGSTATGEELPLHLRIFAQKTAALRYGENPHQRAALYTTGTAGVAAGEQLQGKELSYNNLVDLDAAWQLVNEFDSPAAAIIKHTNPCGCAEQPTLAAAYQKALEADPVSAFGGVTAFNRELDPDTASLLAPLFVEAIAAPEFSEQALRTLTSKKNLRLVKVGVGADPGFVIRSISGGLLAQTPDTSPILRSQMTVKTNRAPSDEEWRALLFAWRVCKHVKSNAIVYARPGQTVSVGAGQMSRVDSVKVGAMKAVLPLECTVLASDAFFPFPDGVREAAEHGITAIIQPGGSVKDQQVIEEANRLNLAMVFTGTRHFRH